MNSLISNARTKLVVAVMTAVLCALGAAGGAWAQTNPAAQALPYAQDFSGLLHTSTTYPAGWQGWTLAATPSATFRLTAPTADVALTASGTAASTTGAIYNYNSQVGFLNSGAIDGAIVLSLNTQLRSGVSVTYDVGTLRNPHDGGTNTRINEATLQYRVGTLGAFTALPASVNYSNNTVTQTAGTTLQNVVNKNITLPAACDNQNVVQIRWVARDVSGGGSRPSFAVDNISITATTLSPLPDLLARWSLDGNINDSSGNGLAAGTTTASPAFVTGIEGTQALGLNGTTQYATVPHDYRLNTPSQITLAAWIRPNAAATQSVISKNMNGTAPAGINGYELTLQTGAGGKPFLRFNQATSGDAFRLNATTPYPTNGTTWMHVAATYDGATARIYVNGVLDASAAMAVPAIATNANPLGIGSQHDGSGARFFNGAIDDARVYSRALDLSEVQALASHTLTYVAGANGTISGTNPQAVLHGGNGTMVTAVPDVGYHFVSWSDGVLTASRTDTNVLTNLSASATFAINTYTLTTIADPVAGGAVNRDDPGPNYNHGAVVQLTAAPNTGYTFTNWTGDAAGVANPLLVTMDATKSVTGNFTLNTYTLTYTAGANGTISGTSPQIVNHGDDGTLVTAVPNAGYHFLSWSDAYPTAARTDLDVTGNITVTANFEIDTPTNTSVVNVGPAPGLITLGNPVRTVPVTISRSDLTPMMAFSVTFTVASPLNLSGGLSGGINEGTYLSTANPITSFNVIDKGAVPGGHSYQADGTTLGPPCGSSAADGTLFTINLASAATSGSGTVTITNIKLRDCSNVDLPNVIGTSATVTIDQSAPTVTVVAPNGAEFWRVGAVENITWTGSDLEGIASYDLAYSTDGGATYPNAIASVPGSSTSYAWTIPAAPGTMTRVRVTALDANGNPGADASDANFTIAYYTLSYLAGLNGTISGTTPQAVAHGGSGTAVTAVPNAGYHFTSWSDGVLTASRTETNVMADLTVTASFAINTYTLTTIADPVAGGVINRNDPGPNYDHGTVVQLTAVPNLGYTFASWSGDASGTTNPVSVTMDAAKTVTAHFTLNTYTLSYTAGAGGTIVGTNPQIVNHGANGTEVVATPNAGFHFVSWSDGYPTAARTDVNVTADVNATATFAINSYTLTTIVDPVGGGVINRDSPGPSYPHGTVVQLTAVPNPGYTFASWSGDATGTTNPVSVTMDAAKTVTAHFTLNAYTLTTIVDPVGGGAINRDSPGPTYPHGTVVQLTAVANSGYTFANWTGDASGSGNPVSVTMDAAKTVTGHFTLNAYTLTYTAGAGGTIVGTNPQIVNHGGNGTEVIATPNAGFHFVSWSDTYPTAARTDLNVTADITATATFAANPAVAPVANLVATQITPGTLDQPTTPIQVNWDATPVGTTVEVWRKGFGSYPEYDDAGGSPPSASATYPPGAGWVKVDGLTSGGTDLVGTRDFYFYVAYAQDGFGTWSEASTLTTGTLNYHLGDVSNGIAAGAGNNKVYSEDISLLGAFYGLINAAVTPVNYLDVGPTTTLYVDGRPTTDNRIDFEDLVMFAINYGLGQVGPAPLTAVPASNVLAVASDEVLLDAPSHVTPGREVSARLTMRGTGAVIAVSARLTWDPAVVEPVGHTAGAWLAQQNGHVFSARPGSVDAAVMRAQGLVGGGELATITFRVRSAGDPKIAIESLDARDARNRGVDVTQTLRPQVVIPATTQLAFARPNPFRQSVTIPFSLSSRGSVALELYSVDGRRVRTLVNENREAGEYDVSWDGRDEHGNAVTAGVYYVRLVTPQGRFTRTITNLR